MPAALTGCWLEPPGRAADEVTAVPASVHSRCSRLRGRGPELLGDGPSPGRLQDAACRQSRGSGLPAHPLAGQDGTDAPFPTAPCKHVPTHEKGALTLE